MCYSWNPLLLYQIHNIRIKKPTQSRMEKIHQYIKEYLVFVPDTCVCNGAIRDSFGFNTKIQKTPVTKGKMLTKTVGGQGRKCIVEESNNCSMCCLMTQNNCYRIRTNGRFWDLNLQLI